MKSDVFDVSKKIPVMSDMSFIISAMYQITVIFAKICNQNVDISTFEHLPSNYPWTINLHLLHYTFIIHATIL